MTDFAPSPEQREVIEYPLAPLRVAAMEQLWARLQHGEDFWAVVLGLRD